MPASNTPQHNVSRSPGSIPLSERQQMALLSRMTEDQKQHHSNLSVNKHGETQLHIAAKQGSEEEVQELLSKGVDPNIQDAAGWTPLHEACIRGRYNVAKTLILAGADANAKGYGGFTPLHDAAANGHAELINLLLDFGADVTQRNHKGQAPVDVAQEQIKIIFRNRADKGEKPTSSSEPASSPISTRNSVMRRLPPHNKVPDSSCSSSSLTSSTSPGPSSSFSSKTSGSPRVTLRINQLKGRLAGHEDTNKKIRSGYSDSLDSSPDTSGLYVSSGNTLLSNTSKSGKMENMEEVLIKENVSSIDPTQGQDETKDPLADTENVTSPSSTNISGGDIKGGSDKEGDKDKDSMGMAAGGKRQYVADTTNSDDESKKKKRKEDMGGTRSKTSSVSGGSPKSNLGNDSDADDHNIKNIESPGPKVPPLKIVLPSANTSSENDLTIGGRNGKSGTTRHSALPYVVASETTETSSPGSPANVATDNATSGGDGGDKTSSVIGGSLTTAVKSESLSSDEQNQRTQRILRSSHSSRGSSSSSPAAPDASPSNPVNTPPSSAVHSPESMETTTNQTEQPSSSTCSTTEDVKPPVIKEEPEPNHQPTPVELHPRKRKLKHARESSLNSNVTSSTTMPSNSTNSSNSSAANSSTTEIKSEPNLELTTPLSEQPFTNCYQLYLNIRKQIDNRRKGLFPVKPVTPSKFGTYLMVTCDYVLASNNSSRHNVPKFEPPANLNPALKDLFQTQEQERYKLRMQHVVEKEKFALGVEQEIIRVHCHAARELANQPLPYSACTILKDEEVYNLIGPDTDEKDSIEHKKDKRTDRYRYNGRLFIKWLRDIDDKWDKIKKRMIMRHTNEAESLHAVQKMDWQWKIKELALDTEMEESHVPLITIVDDFQSTDELAS